MSRKLASFFSVNAVLHIKYVPQIILTIKNWGVFLLNYIGIVNDNNIVVNFRNGDKFLISENIDITTIMVIFFKKEYGKIPKNSSIIDIGSNIGAFSIYAAASKDSKIYAYEPMKKTFESLLSNVKLNNYENKIICNNYGVGSKKGGRKIFINSGSPYSSLYNNKANSDFVEVDIVSLEDVFNFNQIIKCDILKCDCEGAEYEIFYNAPIDIFQRINEIRMEYHNSENENQNIKCLIDFFSKKGFTKTFINEQDIYSGIAWFKNNNFNL